MQTRNEELIKHNVHFNQVEDDSNFDWEKHVANLTEHDDDEERNTPEDVKVMLGFDPKKDPQFLANLQDKNDA
jgi:hypothetical protein